MRRSLYLLVVSALALFREASAFAGDLAPVDETNTVAQEITHSLAEARSDETIAAVRKYILPTTINQSTIDQLAATFNLVTSGGKADIVLGKIWDTTYGDVVEIRIDYLHFPDPNNLPTQFVFMKYTFMKTVGGWQLTHLSCAGGNQFPPPGWSIIPWSR